MIWPFNKTADQIKAEAIEEVRDEQGLPKTKKEKNMDITYTLSPEEITEVLIDYLAAKTDYNYESLKIDFNLGDQDGKKVVENIQATYKSDI